MHLAEGLGLDVIVEGVETEAQRACLLEAGCRYAQGYLFSPPVEPASIVAGWSSPEEPPTGAVRLLV